MSTSWLRVAWRQAGIAAFLVCGLTKRLGVDLEARQAWEKLIPSKQVAAVPEAGPAQSKVECLMASIRGAMFQ